MWSGSWLARVLSAPKLKCRLGSDAGVCGLRLEGNDVCEVFADAWCLRQRTYAADEDAIGAGDVDCAKVLSA